MEYQESATFCNSMEEDEKLKFLFKSCKKKYCGKSVGGHMRSDVIASNSAESEEKVGPNMKKVASLLDMGAKFSQKDAKIEDFGGQCGQGNYGLRENPKKTWRAVDQNFPLPQEKVCKQCGKVFQSLKALCGHMACHSEKERGGGKKDDNSWTSEDSDSETEERIMLRRKSSTSKRFKKVIIDPSSYAFTSTCNNASSSVSEIDEIEKEEVAVCLMMLSRDSSSKCGRLISVEDSSDNDSVVLETIGDKKLKKNDIREMVQPEDSDSDYFLGDATKGESEVSVDEIRRNAAYWEYANSRKGPKGNGFVNGGMTLNLEKKESKKAGKVDICDEVHDDELLDESYKRKKYGSSDNAAEVSNTPYKKSKYECLNCKKSFKSYQALGGHRPCHKRINVYSQSELDANNVADQKPFKNKKVKWEQKVKKSKKQKGHVCPFCPRVFKSGQALGGHKRTHFLFGGGSGNQEFRTRQSREISKEVHDLFDLNLPAPVENEDDNGNVQFRSW